MDLLFDFEGTLQNKEKEKDKEPVKFKPKKPSIPKIQNPSLPPPHSRDADFLLGPGIDYSLSPCSTTDKFESTSNPKIKLQPQRKKQSAAPCSDKSYDISRSDFKALTSPSLEPLPSSENEKERKGKKVNFYVPEEDSPESLDRLLSPGPVTSEEIQGNHASESSLEESSQNGEQGQNCERVTEEEPEDAPNLDIFDFWDDTDPIVETVEADENPEYTGEEEDQGRAKKEMKIDGKMPFHSRNSSSTDDNVNDKYEGTSNPKTKLQPQRKKQSAAPRSNESSDFRRSDFKAPSSPSLEPPLSTAEPTTRIQPKENEKKGKGKKVNFSVPGADSPELLGVPVGPVPITYDEMQVNDASESGVEEITQNNEQGQNGENMTGKEPDDSLNLDIFDFWDNTNPVPETVEADETPTEKDYKGEEEDEGRAEKEMKIDGKKPSRRRKNGSTDAIAVANSEEELPKKKKLPHKIRRKRRKVDDPALLEMPENEIDPKKISIRNLILLAEAKEKKWMKEAASRNSAGDPSFMRRRREQEEFEFCDVEGGEENSRHDDSAPEETFVPTVKKLNYHTYMNRPASTRWTKAETELFYKGIRQFGTDFAMIQQLFPNRTRNQIKLKFKSEDKKQPTRVRDAITNRLTDNSQFEKVIEILEIQADKFTPEESEVPSQKAEEMDEEEENFKTSPSDFDNSGMQESVPTDDLDVLFNWDNQETEQEEIIL